MKTSDVSIRHEVDGCSFSFYSDEELKRVSVKEITNSLVFDAFNNAVPGGLYDAALGPTENHIMCPTCFMTFEDCPGHMGHIKLVFPVYNPLNFGLLYKIIRHKCWSCHRFKGAAEKVRRFQVKLQLLDRGELSLAMGLDAELAAKDGAVETAAEAQTRKEAIFTKYENYACTTPKSEEIYGHARQFRKEVVGEILASFKGTKCENCGAHSPAIRKDGHTKLFQKPLAEKLKSSNSGKGLNLSNALDTMNNSDEGITPSSEKKKKKRKSEEKKDDDDDDDDDASDDDMSVEDDEDDEEGNANTTEAKGPSKETFLPPIEVREQMRKLWQHEEKIVSLVWAPAMTRKESNNSFTSGIRMENPAGWSIFFLEVVPVAPSRFRPPMSMGDMSFEHPQNVFLTKIMKLNEQLVSDDSSKSNTIITSSLERKINTWIQLQEAVNTLMDSSKSDNKKQQEAGGIRQLLEKKEGLFRKNMMGKRVNYAARSVISPDPFLETDEIGIPQKFARNLTYAQAVTPWNVTHLMQLVINGPQTHPGANYVENENGTLIDLSRRSAHQRLAISKTLLNKSGSKPKKVWRHLVSGDTMLVNRQPTLHKPGIMAHRARVLPGNRQVIRMHYANCNTYNADFDGDEINLHFPQNELARAEAYHIVSAKHQYVSPKDGTPLRGLIQDHVGSGLLLTMQDTFLSRDQYFQLVFGAVDGLTSYKSIKTLPPCILKPKQLWTGKQVISTVLSHLIGELPGLNLDSTNKIKQKMWRSNKDSFSAAFSEQFVLFRDNELLRGVLDKSQFGASQYGLVDAVYELYGADHASVLLSSLGRLFTMFTQSRGFTCGMDDLVLNNDAEKERKEIIATADLKGLLAAAEALEIKVSDDNKNNLVELEMEVRSKLQAKLLHDPSGSNSAMMDHAYRSVTSPIASDIISLCLPGGLYKPFPDNMFSTMVASGAKGSMVNHSQISCGLGQQSLEGRRVPVMISGRTLPCFAPYNSSPRAGGFISDRFLTGVRPADYYFHCMAGREGLVDTAVKTSRSGYLQRCLVKHLEDLQVSYDYSVRKSDGGIVQFIYGEDGIDVMNTAYLNGDTKTFDFLVNNYKSLAYKLDMKSSLLNDLKMDLDVTNKAHVEISTHKKHEKEMKERKEERKISKGDVVMARKIADGGEDYDVNRITKDFFKARIKKVREKESKTKYDLEFDDGTVSKKVPDSIEGAHNSKSDMIKSFLPDPVQWQMPICRHLGTIGERLQGKLENYLATNPSHLLNKENEISSNAFQLLLWLKGMKSLVHPGDAVGTLAAQSIGQPSTQMTLNTFHLAGHGAVNVTLGIPRLREVIMTASANIKTPMMELPLEKGLDKSIAQSISQKLYRLKLTELLDHNNGITVTDILKPSSSSINAPWVREYQIKLQLANLVAIKKKYDNDIKQIGATIANSFIDKLLIIIKKESKKTGAHVKSNAEKSKKSKDKQEDNGDEEEGGNKKKDDEKNDKEEGEEDDDEEEDEDNADDGTFKVGNKKQTVGYDDDEEEEEKEEEKVPSASEGEEEDEEEEKDSVGDSEMNDKDEKAALSKNIVPITPTTKITSNKHFKAVYLNSKDGYIDIHLVFPSHKSKMLMVALATVASESVLLRSTPHINNCMVTESEEFKVPAVVTEGVNFPSVWAMRRDGIDVNHITSNDVSAMIKTYGVEAGRRTITNQIKAVFAVYGISVDPRHLGLIADYMTNEGGYTPMNRSGMEKNPSPLLQMSFETTSHFMTSAAIDGIGDDLISPSSKIVLGQPVAVGTGCFDLRVPIAL